VIDLIQKFTRTVASILPVEKNRLGSCNQCGECCKLPFRCFFLKSDDEGKYYCSAYKFRPPICKKFPRTQSQLLLVDAHCGYSFNN